MNSYKHAHISGVLLSLDDNGGDYYLLGIAVRNVAEWVGSQPSLPNNLQLLYHLPHPIPAFNVENPLQLNVSTRKYFQPNNNRVRYIIKPRYYSLRCNEARSKINSTTIFHRLYYNRSYTANLSRHIVLMRLELYSSLCLMAHLPYLQAWVPPFHQSIIFILNVGLISIL